MSSTSTITYAEILADAPSEDILLEIFRRLLTDAADQLKDLIEKSWRKEMKWPDMQTALTSIDRAIYRADCQLATIGVLSDLHQIFSSPPAPKATAATEEEPLPI